MIDLIDIYQDRLALLNKSHVTEMTQRTRLELENEQVSQEELEESIQVGSVAIHRHF